MKHLGTLADAGMVAKERHGREVHYRLESAPLGEATAWLTTLFGALGAASAAAQALCRGATMSEPRPEIRHSVPQR